MSNPYKIQLGIALDTSDLRTEINKLDDKYKLKLGVNVSVDDIKKRISAYNKNTNNTKLHLKVKLDTDDLKKQINSLNLGGSGKGKGVAIPVDTSSLKSSLEKIDSIVDQVRKSLGSLDDVNTKSLVTAVNQIANALEKATNESDGLVASLRTLANKDFSVNFGFNMGKSASQISSEQGDIKRDAISQLKQQAKALEDYLDQYYKVSQKQEGIVKLTQGTNLFSSFWEMSPNIGNTKNSLKQQVATYKQYIDLIQEAAKIKGVDLSSVTAGFSKTTDDIVKGTNSATNSVEELKQSFKGLLGSGIDSEVLTGISQDLAEIKKAFEALSSIGTIDGLTTSFKELSEVLDKLTSNITTVKKSLDDIGNVGGSVGQGSNGVDNLENDLKQVENAAETASDAIKQTVNEAKKLDNISIDISDGNLSKFGQTDDIVVNVKNTADELSAAFSKLKNIQKNINSIKFDLSGGIDISKDVKQIQTLERQLDSLQAEYNETKAVLNSKGGISSTQFQSLQNEAKNTELKLEQLKASITDARNELARQIKVDLETGEFTNKVMKLRENVGKLSDVSTGLQDSLNKVDAAMDSIRMAAAVNDTERLIKAYKELDITLEAANKQYQQNKIIERNANNVTALEQKTRGLSLDMDNWLKDNSAAAKQFGDAIRELQIRLESCNDVEFGNIKSEFQNIKKEAKSLGLTTKSVGDKLKEQFRQYSTYLGVAELFMWAEQGLRSMFEQVKLIDSAMTELKKVTDETDASYNQFLTNAASRAKEIGTTIDGLVESTADFARLGYGFEDAQGLAEVANIYAVVGDDIDSVETATESLISTLTAFKDEANGLSDSDFALSIVDKMNEVSNNFAISSGGIGEALQRSASSMMAANNSLDETIALITAANTVVQDPASVGQAFKTISMRIRGAATELQEAGLDTEGMAESTAKLREEIKALSGVDIMIND